MALAALRWVDEEEGEERMFWNCDYCYEIFVKSLRMSKISAPAKQILKHLRKFFFLIHRDKQQTPDHPQFSHSTINTM